MAMHAGSSSWTANRILDLMQTAHRPAIDRFVADFDTLLTSANGKDARGVAIRQLAESLTLALDVLETFILTRDEQAAFLTAVIDTAQLIDATRPGGVTQRREATMAAWERLWGTPAPVPKTSSSPAPAAASSTVQENPS